MGQADLHTFEACRSQVRDSRDTVVLESEVNMNSEPFVLKPAPSLRELAKRSWEQMAQSQREKEHIAGKFRYGYWWAVWEDANLRIKRQLTPAPGTAFGGVHNVAATSTLGQPIIEYDREAIAATGLNDNDSTLDDVADTMVELAKLLKERCRQSGWACVEISGASEAVQKLKDRLNNDPNAPSVFDAGIASAVESSRSDRS